MNPNDFESIVSGAAKGGWDWFDKVNPDAQRAVNIQQEKDAEDAKAVSRAWAQFANTAEGRKALERLFDTTLRRTVFFVSLGLDMPSMATFGAFREGQNAVAHEIARQIAMGNAETIQPRET